jgi:hypothetical protein
MLFNAILISGLVAMFIGSTGIAGKQLSPTFMVAGALLMGCIVCSFFIQFSAGRAGSAPGDSRRLLRQMMAQEKACRAEERRAAAIQQAALMELVRQQGQQQTEALKAITDMSRDAMALQAASNRDAMALQAASNRDAMALQASATSQSYEQTAMLVIKLLNAGARLDQDDRTGEYVAQLKGQSYPVSYEEAEQWAALAPEQVSPRLLLLPEGDQ